MKDTFLSLLLGIALGWISLGAYYDGFVVDRHREQITSFSDALKRAHLEILTLQETQETLKRFLIHLLEQEAEKEKVRQYNSI
jgi:hypothetical protein